jgi:hypothetical protein
MRGISYGSGSKVYWLVHTCRYIEPFGNPAVLRSCVTGTHLPSIRIHSYILPCLPISASPCVSVDLFQRRNRPCVECQLVVFVLFAILTSIPWRCDRSHDTGATVYVVPLSVACVSVGNDEEFAPASSRLMWGLPITH